jgi:hypothetical protein
MIVALLTAGAASALYGEIDLGAWRAYERLEEDWIRERHSLLIAQSPEAAGAAALDLDLKLAELQRRSREFRYLKRRNPQELRGGIWQLSWLPLTGKHRSSLLARDADYRRHEQRIRELNDTLHAHPEYESFRQAQTRLWKTPEYKRIHRRYTGRLQELQRVYGRDAF